MDKMLYVAMTGAAHINRAQTLHANNLANVNTTGFRADFAQARAVNVFGDGYPARTYALAENPATDLSQGAMQQTGRDLDVAVQGDGFIAVQAPDGSEAYTREGDLFIDSAGVLRTGTGNPVLGEGGPIAIPPVTRLFIGSDGTITVQPQGQGSDALVQVGRIKLVKPDPQSIAKSTDGLLRRRDGGTEASDPSVALVSGFLEGSNVNAVQEMTSIMALARQFEMQVKLMRTAEQNDQAATSLLRVG